jgi:hypothetical protein
LERKGWSPFPFAFHDREESGPRMLVQIAKRTGLRREDFESGVADLAENHRAKILESLRRRMKVSA